MDNCQMSFQTKSPGRLRWGMDQGGTHFINSAIWGERNMFYLTSLTMWQGWENCGGKGERHSPAKPWLGETAQLTHSPWHIRRSKCSEQHVWRERTSEPFLSLPGPQCRCCRCWWTGGVPGSLYWYNLAGTLSGSMVLGDQWPLARRLQKCQ